MLLCTEMQKNKKQTPHTERQRESMFNTNKHPVWTHTHAVLWVVVCTCLYPRWVLVYHAGFVRDHGRPLLLLLLQHYYIQQKAAKPDIHYYRSMSGTKYFVLRSTQQSSRRV